MCGVRPWPGGPYQVPRLGSGAEAALRYRFRQRLCGVRGAQGCSRLWSSAPSSRARASALSALASA